MQCATRLNDYLQSRVPLVSRKKWSWLYGQEIGCAYRRKTGHACVSRQVSSECHCTLLLSVFSGSNTTFHLEHYCAAALTSDAPCVSFPKHAMCQCSMRPLAHCMDRVTMQHESVPFYMRRVVHFVQTCDKFLFLCSRRNRHNYASSSRTKPATLWAQM